MAAKKPGSLAGAGLSGKRSPYFDDDTKLAWAAPFLSFFCLIQLIVERSFSPVFSISETAEWGDVTVGPKIIDASVKKRMQKQLKEIESGKFAKEWIAEATTGGYKKFDAIRKAEAAHPIEKVGERLRSTMSWIKQKKLKKGAAQASFVSSSK